MISFLSITMRIKITNVRPTCKIKYIFIDWSERPILPPSLVGVDRKRTGQMRKGISTIPKAKKMNLS